MKKPMPRGVSKRKHGSGNETLQIAFTFRGVRCRESLANIGTRPADIKYAENLLGQIKLQISQGTFKYADYFPKSPKLEIFGEEKTKLTVKDYLDEYMIVCKTKGIAPTTLYTYECNVSRLEPLHNVRVVDLKQADLKNYFKSETTSLKTCKKRLGVLKRALDEAIVDGIIVVNPCFGFNLERYVASDQRLYNTTDEIDPFTPTECKLLIEAAYKISEPDGNMIKFWLNTGLRTGELIGLPWSNVDLVNRNIRVTQALVKYKLTDPKTKSGIRTVPLNDDAYDAIVRQKAQTFMSFDYVFKRNGEPWGDAKRVMDLLWAHLIKRSGVRHRRGYNCRHTFATMNISKNENLWRLSKWLGHTSPEMLFKHYGSYIEEFAKEQDKEAIYKDAVNK